jgi:beta-lactamase regulating signal transducer with metallopeptidase domain/protocatechuate 3,4-dioxygenase beta subunit
MTVSQSFVVLWAQFAAAACVLLVATRVLLTWVRQPVERIRLIQVTMLAALAVPALLALAPWPAARLEVFSAATMTPAGQPVNNASQLAGQPVHDAPPATLRPIDEATAYSLAEPAADNVVVADRLARAGGVEVAPTRHRRASYFPVAVDGWTWAAISIGLIHGIALVFFLAEWGLGAYRLRRVIHSTVAARRHVLNGWQLVTQGRGSHVKLVISPSVQTPLTFGWLRPVVVIPQKIAAAGGDSLQYCLAHEWCHVQRADILSWQGLWACQLVLWYQPQFWTLRRELRICQDIIADNQATADKTAALAYSELLVSFARNRQTAAVAGALAMFDHPNQLMRRVTMLLVRPIQLRSQCSWRFSLAAAALAALAAVAISGVRLDTVRANDKVQKQESQEQVKPAAAAAAPATNDGKTAKEKEQPVEKNKEPVPPENQPAHLTYHCTVLDKETGQGVPNATVTIDRMDSSSGHFPFKSVAKTTHVTDADGKFTIEIPPEQSGNPSLYMQVYVEHDDYVRIPGIGYSLTMIRKNETVGERPFFENLKLQPADRVTAKVVSPSGEPLAGVKIFGFTSPKVRELNNIRWLEGTTAADGSFRLNIMKGGIGIFWVMPNDYSIVQKFVSNQAGDLGEIRVPEGIRIRGRTLSAGGKPLAGVAVNAIYQGRDEAVQTYSVLTGIRRGVITDAEGRFTFDPLPPGEYRVVPDEQLIDPRLERDLHPLPAVFVAQKITLKEGLAPPDLELQAVPHINFHVQYLDSQGKKRKGSEFHVSGRLDSEFWSARGRPDKDGTATVRLPHGLQNVQVGLITNEHSSLRHRKGPGKPIENHNHNVELGTLNDDVEGFEIIRYKAPIALVQAVDSEGRPVRHFSVTAKYPWGEQRYVLKGEQRSDVSFEHQNDGRYRTSQMLPDEEVTFTATAAGYQPASETVKFTEGETKDVVIKLKAVSAAVDAINSAVDGAAQLLDQLKPKAPPKQE